MTKLAKTEEPLIVPMELTCVTGIAVGVSAHVSKPGYVPATPLPKPGHTAKFFVLWLDRVQLQVMDGTEPNYDRVSLPKAGTPHLRVPAGARCQAYLTKHGILTGRGSELPRELIPQRQLITELLAESAALRSLAGDSPESWITTMRSEENRERAKMLWVNENRVQPPPGDLIGDGLQSPAVW